MKTLILTGSPRRQGHTNQMLAYMMAKSNLDYDVINAYDLDISPCKDCRYCWHKKACPIDDPMQSIYKKIEEAQVIILASPVYFHSLPAPLKTLIDRCQVYWARVKRGDKKIIDKIGCSLLVGGAPDFDKQFLATEMTVNGWLNDVGAENIGSVQMANSDVTSLKTNEKIRDEIDQLLSQLENRRAAIGEA